MRDVCGAPYGLMQCVPGVPNADAETQPDDAMPRAAPMPGVSVRDAAYEAMHDGCDVLNGPCDGLHDDVGRLWLSSVWLSTRRCDVPRQH